MRLRLVAGLVLIALTSGSVWLVWRTNGSAAALASAARVVEIPAHAGILSIAASLGRAEVIESVSVPLLFYTGRFGTMRTLEEDG